MGKRTKGARARGRRRRQRADGDHTSSALLVLILHSSALVLSFSSHCLLPPQPDSVNGGSGETKGILLNPVPIVPEPPFIFHPPSRTSSSLYPSSPLDSPSPTLRVRSKVREVCISFKLGDPVSRYNCYRHLLFLVSTLASRNLE